MWKWTFDKLSQILTQYVKPCLDFRYLQSCFIPCHIITERHVYSVTPVHPFMPVCIHVQMYIFFSVHFGPFTFCSVYILAHLHFLLCTLWPIYILFCVHFGPFTFSSSSFNVIPTCLLLGEPSMVAGLNLEWQYLNIISLI